MCLLLLCFLIFVQFLSLCATFFVQNIICGFIIFVTSLMAAVCVCNNHYKPDLEKYSDTFSRLGNHGQAAPLHLVHWIVSVKFGTPDLLVFHNTKSLGLHSCWHLHAQSRGPKCSVFTLPFIGKWIIIYLELVHSHCTSFTFEALQRFVFTDWNPPSTLLWLSPVYIYPLD